MAEKRGSGKVSRPDTVTAARLLGELDERTQQVALINGVLRTILTGAPLTDILRVFASNLKSLCPFDRCSVALYDEKRRTFRVPYMVFGGRVIETGEPARTYGSSPLARAVETGRAVLRRDIMKETRKFAADTQFLRKGFASELLLPLEAGARPVGTFNLACFEAGRLEERHVDLLRELVPAIAMAVWHRARAR